MSSMFHRILRSAVAGTLVLASLAAASGTAQAATAPGTAQATASASPVDPARLQQLLDATHAAGMPGIFGQVRDGERTWGLAAGVADIVTNRPVRPWYEHRVGSITKTFMATTVLQLVGEHRVELDAPIGRYLPDVVPGELGRQVTVRMLLNHTSGIGNYTNAISSLDDLEAMRTTTFTPRELVATGLAMPPTNAPGAGWSYSNTNYIIIGLLIERLTGRPVAVEVGRRILRPLGLTGTYFPGTDPNIRGPHDNAYVPWYDGTLRDFTVFNMSWGWAAGELISTPQDLNRFYRALLTGRLLRPSLLAEMQRSVPMYPDAPEATGYGLGLYWVQLPCGRVWGHDGGVIGQATISWHSPDGRRQVTVADNMTFYQVPGEVSPIDQARAQFLVEALCGSETAGSETAGASGASAASTDAAVPGSVTAALLRLPLTPDLSFRR